MNLQKLIKASPLSPDFPEKEFDIELQIGRAHV